MKEKINIKNRYILLILIGLLVAGSFSIGVWATPENDGWWTTAASTGTIDEDDISIYETNGANIYLKRSSPVPSSMYVRYNIVAVDSLTEDNFQEMTVLYKDNSNSARVVVKLRETNMTDGTTKTRMTFDSNKYPQSSSYQKQTISVNGAWFGYDFANNVYYLEATISKTSSSGSPVLVGIQLT